MKREPAYYLNLYKKQILVTLGVLVAIVTLVALAFNIWLMDRRAGLVAVDVLTAPSESKITLNTDEVIGNGTVYLEPGEYTAKIEAEGFFKTEETLVVMEGEKPTLYVGLAPETDEARDWVQWNRRAFGELERRTREAGVIYTQSIRDNYPIVEDLPLRDPYYTVGYRASEEYGVIVTIKGTSPRYRQEAIKAIEAKGYNLAEYVVEYQGFENPLQLSRVIEPSDEEDSIRNDDSEGSDSQINSSVELDIESSEVGDE